MILCDAVSGSELRVKSKAIDASSDHIVSTGGGALSQLKLQRTNERNPTDTTATPSVATRQPVSASTRSEGEASCIFCSFLVTADCASVSPSASQCCLGSSVGICCNHCAPPPLHLVPPLTWALSVEGLISRLTIKVSCLPIFIGR